MVSFRYFIMLLHISLIHEHFHWLLSALRGLLLLRERGHGIYDAHLSASNYMHLIYNKCKSAFVRVCVYLWIAHWRLTRVLYF